MKEKKFKPFIYLMNAKKYLKTLDFRTKSQIELDALFRMKNDGPVEALNFYLDCLETALVFDNMAAYALYGHYYVKKNRRAYK